MTRARKKNTWIPPRTAEERTIVALDNRERWPYAIGTSVRYWPLRKRGRFEGEPLETTTRTGAFRDVNGELVIYLNAMAGYVLVSHLEVLCPAPSSP
jgi:hypothetical protein